jgi:malto-oligosyltrehalose trehalohydrolase
VADAWGPAIGPETTRFRLWAPGVDALELILDDGARPMRAAGDGWWQAEAPARAGDPYAFRLPSGLTVPDPAARAQAGDVHGPSRLVAPGHAWRHDGPRRPWEEAVICEIHIGTFTPEGTFRAAIEKLPLLAEAGYTAIDILPVAQFGGDRGWGYDGVLLYAPHPAYGTTDDLRALVDAAHGAGLMVMLDVVYNHFGPDGNYLGAYAPAFFDANRQTPWGAGIDYARPAVRRFFVENALHWIRDYRIDGFRFDAIDQIRDASDPELLVEIARAVRAEAPWAWMMTEDNRNVTHLHPYEGPRIMDGEWNDDWHNAAHVILTGETDGYYDAFARAPHAKLARCLAEGFAHQGEADGPEGPHGGPWGEDSRGQPPQAFVDFLQNHDQTGNRARGERLTALAEPAALEAMQAILLLSPHVPLMFMGEEWGAAEPFLFFAGFEGDLARAVTEGRRREFADFGGFGGAVPDPIDPATFAASRIDWAARDRATGRAALARVRALLALRRRHVIPHLADAGGHGGAVLPAPEGAVCVDWRLAGAGLHLRANLTGAALDLPAAPGAPIHLTGAARGAPWSAEWSAS